MLQPEAAGGFHKSRNLNLLVCEMGRVVAARADTAKKSGEPPKKDLQRVMLVIV